MSFDLTGKGDIVERSGPKEGIHLSKEHARVVFAKYLRKDLANYVETTLGYNNRLYFATTTDGEEFVVKVGGKYWRHSKTENEVSGNYLVSKFTSVPVPRILAWDSLGKEFGVEYVVLEKVSGDNLDDVWPKLSSEDRLKVIKKLASIVVQFKTLIPSTALRVDAIGHLALVDKEKMLIKVGPTIEGHGPWPDYETYFSSKVARLLQDLKSKDEPGWRAFVSYIPKFESILKSMKGRLRNRSLFFSHGDFNFRNIIMRGTDVVSVLDWEWCGSLPEDEEYWLSYEFLRDLSKEERDSWNSILEEGGVPTERTIKDFDLCHSLYDFSEHIAPWFLTELNDVQGSSEIIKVALQELKTALAVMARAGFT